MKEHLDRSKEKMQKAIEAFQTHLLSVRSGRANANLLNGVEVEYYGAPTPINQIGSISIVEGRQIVIKPFDTTILRDIEKAINEANLNLSPQNDGSVVRINVPALTTETRKELTKVVSKYAEDAKVACRNVRRDENELAKKNKEFTEDVLKDFLEKNQKVTDDAIKKIDALAAEKSEEIMTI